MRKNIDAMTPGNGNRNGENKKEWYDYTKKYLEIFGVRLSFVTKYSETPPPPFLTTPPFFRGNRNSRSSLYSFCKSCNVVCRKQSKEVLVLVLWSKVTVAWIYFGASQMTFLQRLDSENAGGSVLQFAKQYRIRGKCYVAQIINNMYVFPLHDKRQRHILVRGLSLHENMIYDR